jgi:hypothetical protein
MSLFLLLGVVSFLAIGVSILLTLNLAKLSGWKRVAAKYATSTFPTHCLESWVTGRMGAFLYRNLVLAADQRGLYMRTVRGTSVFHTPLFVAWEDISIGEGRNLWFPMVRFTFSKAVRGSIMLEPNLAKKLLDKKTAGR